MDLCIWKGDLNLAISKTKYRTDCGWIGSKENAGNALYISARTWHLQHIIFLPATEQQWLGRGLRARCHPHLVVLAQAVSLKWTAKQNEYGVFLVLLAWQGIEIGKVFWAMSSPESGIALHRFVEFTALTKQNLGDGIRVNRPRTKRDMRTCLTAVSLRVMNTEQTISPCTSPRQLWAHCGTQSPGCVSQW